jgi:hypothetical protein
MAIVTANRNWLRSVSLAVCAVLVSSAGALAMTCEEIAEACRTNRDQIQNYQARVVRNTREYLESAPETPLGSTWRETLFLFSGDRYRIERQSRDSVDAELLRREQPEVWEKMQTREPGAQDGHTVATFDGERFCTWNMNKQEGTTGLGRPLPMADELDRAYHVSLSDLLKVGHASDVCLRQGAKVLREEGEGRQRMVWVGLPVESRVYLARDHVRAEVAILPEQGCVIAEARYFDAEGHLRSVFRAEDVAQHDGIWLAGKASREYYFVAEDGEGTWLRNRHEATLVEFEADPSVSVEDFRIDFPVGTTVVDQVDKTTLVVE